MELLKEHKQPRLMHIRYKGEIVLVGVGGDCGDTKEATSDQYKILATMYPYMFKKKKAVINETKE